MDVQEAWLRIIKHLQEGTNEFPTVPIVKKAPVWFSASLQGDIIAIKAAQINKPSSNITVLRKLKYKTFEKVYPLYLRRSKGESVSAEVTKATLNSVYYFSLIKHCATYNVGMQKAGFIIPFRFSNIIVDN